MAITQPTFLLALAAGLVSACNGVDFCTNIGPYTEGRLASAAVQVYSPAEIGRYDAVALGMVEANACRTRPDQPEPRRADLERKMKTRAHKLGANGLVIEACGTTVSGTCQTYVECRGQAYSVPERQSRP